MRIYILIIINFLLVSCASTPPEMVVIKRYESPKLHNADCHIDNQRYSESNLMLLEETESVYKMKAGDGKILGLPIRSCILSQIPLESGFDISEPKQRWVKCSLGKMSLVTDSLIYQDDEKNFYRLKRKDGQVWMLPREHCAIFRFDPKEMLDAESAQPSQGE